MFFIQCTVAHRRMQTKSKRPVQQRLHAAMRCAAASEDVVATTAIQCATRGMIARSRRAAVNAAAVSIQRAARGKIARSRRTAVPRRTPDVEIPTWSAAKAAFSEAAAIVAAIYSAGNLALTPVAVIDAQSPLLQNMPRPGGRVQLNMDHIDRTSSGYRHALRELDAQALPAGREPCRAVARAAPRIPSAHARPGMHVVRAAPRLHNIQVSAPSCKPRQRMAAAPASGIHGTSASAPTLNARIPSAATLRAGSIPPAYATRHPCHANGSTHRTPHARPPEHRSAPELMPATVDQSPWDGRLAGRAVSDLHCASLHDKLTASAADTLTESQADLRKEYAMYYEALPPAGDPRTPAVGTQGSTAGQRHRRPPSLGDKASIPRPQEGVYLRRTGKGGPPGHADSLYKIPNVALFGKMGEAWRKQRRRQEAEERDLIVPRRRVPARY